ncbi:MAG: hypothetical protein LH618_07210 [Saprospiraceae bacterium]|nr:hypothetical protein [Saprospiraceae bacterium]
MIVCNRFAMSPTIEYALVSGLGYPVTEWATCQSRVYKSIDRQNSGVKNNYWQFIYEAVLLHGIQAFQSLLFAKTIKCHYQIENNTSHGAKPNTGCTPAKLVRTHRGRP